MKNKLLSLAVFFSLLVVSVFAFPLLFGRHKDTQKMNEQLDIILDLNEVQQLYCSGNTEDADRNIELIKEKVYALDTDDSYQYRYSIIQCGLVLLIISGLLSYIYLSILRPFGKMQKYAEEISYGNYDKPINLERSPYFSGFSWAFDKMRQEISRSRQNEKAAIEKNKTVIAALSHDIKTPVASIRAYAEGLGDGLADSAEKQTRYYSTIIKKCDELKALVNDLVMHSLTDLDKLSIKESNFELCDFLGRVLDELSVGQNVINYSEPEFRIWICADPVRLTQIIENIIGNSQKYSNTDIDVMLEFNNGNSEIHFRDYGPGIPDEDMPFIFDKFYRGHNSSHSEGTGLGLYIVRYLVEKMSGTISIINHDKGCEAVVVFPIKKN